jgi:hypothetical protein
VEALVGSTVVSGERWSCPISTTPAILAFI